MNSPYNVRPVHPPRPARRSYAGIFTGILLILLLIGGYGAYALLRPLPGLQTTVLPPVVPAKVRVSMPWPAEGQAAFGADGYGQLTAHGTQKPSPTASVAKVITALAVLQKKPLKQGETGPLITMTARDVELYNKYVANDGAVVPVYEGQTISEYQALQAMLLPSANNIADTTAVWAFGSQEAYAAFANSMVRTLGMRQTTVGSDASGFSPSTTSTAADLVRLGDAALDNPVLAQVISQSEATFPDYGTIHNVNTLLGQSGIRGIKTGNTEEAGGCYLAAADITAAGKKVTVITAIMGSSSRGQAMKDSVPLIGAAISQFQDIHVVRSGQSVGHVTSVWGSSADVTAKDDMTVLGWAGTALSPTTTTKTATAPLAAGSDVAMLHLTSAGVSYSTRLLTTRTIPEPTTMWRLTHPF